MTELSRDEERRARAVDLAIKALQREGRAWTPYGVGTEVIPAAVKIERYIETGQEAQR